MYTIEIRIRCPDGSQELFPDSVEATELMVESIVSQALLELFEVMKIEEVSIQLAPGKEHKSDDDHLIAS